MWGASAVAAAVFALIAYVVVGDEGQTDTAYREMGQRRVVDVLTRPDGPKHARPDGWTEPSRWAVLPRGGEEDGRGRPIRFPHTVDGAVAMLIEANETEAKEDHTLADEQLALFESYMGEAGRTEEYKREATAIAARNDAALRRDMGLPDRGALPLGAYIRATVLGFQVIASSDDEVSVWLLSRVTAKSGQLQEEKASYTRNVLAAHWEDGDWKISPHAMERAAEHIKGKPRPAFGIPGDAKFNEAGWTAIRQAS